MGGGGGFGFGRGGPRDGAVEVLLYLLCMLVSDFNQRSPGRLWGKGDLGWTMYSSFSAREISWMKPLPERAATPRPVNSVHPHDGDLFKSVRSIRRRVRGFPLFWDGVRALVQSMIQGHSFALRSNRFVRLVGLQRMNRDVSSSLLSLRLECYL